MAVTNPFGTTVSQGFAPIYSMIGTGTPSGGGSGAFGLQPQSMSGNSLTQGERAVNNLLGLTGGQLGQLGQGVLGAGLGVSEGGLNLLQTPAAFWGALASGDPTAMTQAISPQMAFASQLANATQTQLNNQVPRGGFGSLSAANLGPALAAQGGNFALQQGPLAAQQLAQLGGLEGQLGLGIGGMGTTLTGQGLQGLTSAQQGDLQKMQLNLQEGSPFQDILGTISAITGGKGVAPLIGGIAGLFGGSKTPGSTSGSAQV